MTDDELRRAIEDEIRFNISASYGYTNEPPYIDGVAEAVEGMMKIFEQNKPKLEKIGVLEGSKLYRTAKQGGPWPTSDTSTPVYRIVES